MSTALAGGARRRHLQPVRGLARASVPFLERVR